MVRSELQSIRNKHLIHIIGLPIIPTKCFMLKYLIWCMLFFRQNSRQSSSIFSRFHSSGAIRRVAVEKEHPISYESFVNELDTGDSFTLSLVDILVKVGSYLYFLAALVV